MKKQSKFSEIMSVLVVFIAITAVAYGFLTLTNWSPRIGEWNGFSRFILGVIGVIFLIRIIDEI